MSGLYASFDVASDDKEDLDRAIRLALNSWQDQVDHFMVTYGWLVFWRSNEPDESSVLPASAGPNVICPMIHSWLKDAHDHPEFLDRRPDGDGSSYKGWRVLSGDSLALLPESIENRIWATVAVGPEWIHYGK